tara:strand:- start:3520 stop:4245 length:726 start_codon:yes stop_codon:yes gene_type:complete
MDQVVFDKFLLWDIDDTEKEKILNCCAQAQDEIAFGEAFDDACLEFKLSGDNLPLADIENMGHVKSRNAFITALEKVTIWSGKDIENQLQQIAHPDLKVAQSALEMLFAPFQDNDDEPDDQTRLTPLSRRPTWLYFLPENPAAPYDLKISCLPARLGLRGFGDGVKRFVGFEISRTKVNNPSGPTIADAGYNCTKEYWSPGGKTKPRCHCEECRTSSGLNEIVCESILISEIELKLELIEV